MTIPALAHFVWFGRTLPWVHAVAPLSAARRGGFDRVILHHADDLAGDASFVALQRTGDVEARRLVPAEWLEPAGGAALMDVYRRLTTPSPRSDVLRTAILHQQGGVYLDMDTLTVRPLTPLGAAGGVYCGEERIAFPARVTRSRRPDMLLAAVLRHGIRDLLRRTPRGWRVFRAIEGWYWRAANGAILAGVAGHPFLRALLDGMVAMPPARQTASCALGPHLIEDNVVAYRGDDLTVHPPEVFFPLGPEIAEHWVRPARGEAARELLRPETRVVHWYASTGARRFVADWTPATLPRHAAVQPLAWLAVRSLAPPES